MESLTNSLEKKNMVQRKNIAYLERTLARAGFGFVSYGQETHNQRWFGREEAHGSKKRKHHIIFTKSPSTVEQQWESRDFCA